MTDRGTFTSAAHPWLATIIHPVVVAQARLRACVTDRMAFDDSPDSGSIVSRRRVLGGAGLVLAGGGGVLALTGDRASAQVTMGELDVTADAATVDSPPASIDISTTGEWVVDATTTPAQVQQVLQVHVGGEGGDVDDLAEDAAFDATSGTFDLSADLYSHSGVSQGDLTPAGGETKDTTLLIRVIISAVVDGSIAAEAHTQDTVTLSITHQGMEVQVGGSGSVVVVTG